MTVVVDTSVLIDHLRGNERARVIIRDAIDAGRMVASSVLTKTEVLAGMRAAEESATRELLSALQWVEVDEWLAERAGTLANEYLKSHPEIDVVDYVIAATTELLGAELWTQNVRHFPMIRGLQPPY